MVVLYFPESDGSACPAFPAFSHEEAEAYSIFSWTAEW